MTGTTSPLRAWTGAAIYDGDVLHTGKALLLDGERLAGIVAKHDLPGEATRVHLDGGTILPGFVDLQVNGGGGVLFNDAPTLDGLRIIAAAHARTGTRAILPTLITDTPDTTRAAIDAVAAAVQAGVPGIVGLHLEGPHLALARKGAHDAALIRPMQDADEALLLEAAARLPNLMVTVAPESVSNDRITRLAQAGVIVSLGHSDCTYAQAKAAFAAGARCVTHLFNAMSQLGSREPGLVGAALDAGGIAAGLIADAVHVDPATIRVALAAKTGTAGLFLVTDAMPTVGSEITEFHLNGRRVLRRDGRLTLEDGTLAGADLDMPSAVRVMTKRVGVDPSLAFGMATSGPARLLSDAMGVGRLKIGQDWTGIYLDQDTRYQGSLLTAG